MEQKITKKPLILCLKMLFLACQKDKCPNGTHLAFFDRLFLLENQCFLRVSKDFKNPPIKKWGFNLYFSLKKIGRIFDRLCVVIYIRKTGRRMKGL
nr:MAG TPA: hypothetical protein [Caudoviricetes sp.]